MNVFMLSHDGTEYWVTPFKYVHGEEDHDWGYGSREEAIEQADFFLVEAQPDGGVVSTSRCDTLSEAISAILLESKLVTA